MSEKIPAALKRQVARRAGFRSEYCRLSEAVSFYVFHVDHIRSLKHGGLTILLNLAYCCPDCNFFKGSDVTTYSADEQFFTRFFNPRKDAWDDHFTLAESAIYGTTDIGKSTERIFKFNDPDRLIFRRQLAALSLYP